MQAVNDALKLIASAKKVLEPLKNEESIQQAITLLNKALDKLAESSI